MSSARRTDITTFVHSALGPPPPSTTHSTPTSFPQTYRLPLGIVPHPFSHTAFLEIRLRSPSWIEKPLITCDSDDGSRLHQHVWTAVRKRDELKGTGMTKTSVFEAVEDWAQGGRSGGSRQRSRSNRRTKQARRKWPWLRTDHAAAVFVAVLVVGLAVLGAWRLGVGGVGGGARAGDKMETEDVAAMRRDDATSTTERGTVYLLSVHGTTRDSSGKNALGPKTFMLTRGGG